MYTFFIKQSKTAFEVYPMKKNVQTYLIAESAPQKLTKGFVEAFKNGETKVVKMETRDDPDATRFETFSELENVSATIWGFKCHENSEKKIVIFSDLPKSILHDGLSSLLQKLSDKERAELL